MSEDRLENALEEMKRESVDAATLDAARARVWNTLTNTAVDGCAEFRPDLHVYLAGTLTAGRRMLLEDHVSRCAACRTALAEMKGERRVIAMPRRSSVARAALGNARCGRRAGLLGPVSRTRHHRRLDGARRPAGDSGLRQRRAVPPACLERSRGVRRRARRRRRHRRKGADPHGSGRARGAAPRRRFDGRCQPANGALRNRCMERSGHSSPARRRHRPGGEAAPRTPAGPDA